VRFYIKNTEIKISLWFLPAVPAVIAAGYVHSFLAAFISIVLHEFSHAAMAVFFKAEILSVSVTPIGLRLSIDDIKLIKRELLCLYFAGPFSNLLISAISWLVIFISGVGESYLSNIYTYLQNMMKINICLAVFNLLPAVPFDGGRITQIILSEKYGSKLSAKYVKTLLCVISILLIVIGVYAVFVSKPNFSVLLAGAYLMTAFLYEGRGAAFMNIKQLYFRKSRLIKKGIYPARDLVALKTTSLGEVLKNMDYDMFHFIYIIDTEMELMGVLTENHILNGIMERGIGCTLEELLLIKY
jgi:stage IV sporulation protein FB